MFNYYETNLAFIKPKLKETIIKFVETEFNLYITVNHNLPNKQTKFIFSKLPKYLNDEVLESLPARFKGPALDPFIRIQYSAGGKVDPHIDAGRMSGLITVLTDDESTTDFYTWKSNASCELIDSLYVAKLKEIDPCESVVFERDKTYLFNHASIHNVTTRDKPRITINVLYRDVPFDQLIKIYAD
jgi:hypothetical protein